MWKHDDKGPIIGHVYDLDKLPKTDFKSMQHLVIETFHQTILRALKDKLFALRGNGISKPKLGMFSALSHNYQHCFWKLIFGILKKVVRES